MSVNSSCFRTVLALGILIGLPAAITAQKGKGSPHSSSVPTSNPSQPTLTQPLFISGRVLLEGGAAPPEPVAIERVCNGAVRKQSYTDSSGAFQFQLDQNPVVLDASETPANSSISTNTSLTNNQTQEALKLRYQGCEIRAVLPGFTSSSAVLRLQGSTWQYDLGVIFIKRTENVLGTTISATTMAAPDRAKRAYEKGHKAFDENRLSDAEKELDIAVKIYPNFAVAWSLLGDIHQLQKQFDPAIKEYTQALAADPRFVNPSFGLALIAMQEKRWQDVVTFTDQVAKMNSLAFPSAYFYNAVANYNLGRTEPAEQSARKFKSLDVEHRHPDVCLLLGQILIQKNDGPAAALEMREYLILAPTAANAEEVRQWLKNYDDATVAKQQPQ
jgi:tetratricopeptide (TPR) repeat protein